MAYCWYCHWGWAKQVADIYAKYLALLDNNDMLLEYQHAHIVWSDENFDTNSINLCIRDADKYWDRENVTQEQHDLITESLKELLLVPEEIRCCQPEEFEEDNDLLPENYPPPKGIVMIRKY